MIAGAPAVLLADRGRPLPRRRQPAAWPGSASGCSAVAAPTVIVLAAPTWPEASVVTASLAALEAGRSAGGRGRARHRRRRQPGGGPGRGRPRSDHWHDHPGQPRALPGRGPRRVPGAVDRARRLDPDAAARGPGARAPALAAERGGIVVGVGRRHRRRHGPARAVPPRRGAGPRLLRRGLSRAPARGRSRRRDQAPPRRPRSDQRRWSAVPPRDPRGRAPRSSQRRAHLSGRRQPRRAAVLRDGAVARVDPGRAVRRRTAAGAAGGRADRAALGRAGRGPRGRPGPRRRQAGQRDGGRGPRRRAPGAPRLRAGAPAPGRARGVGWRHPGLHGARAAPATAGSTRAPTCSRSGWCW
jgi:hypothetical protein